MRLKSPMRQVSEKTAEWRRWRLQNYALLTKRCYGACEGCGLRVSLEPHHVAGREEEPFSSAVELLAGLCRGCHRGVTGEVGRGINVGLRARLASDALQRLTARYEVHAGNLNAALKQMKRLYTYDPTRNSIVLSSDF
jgi:hypothetical protein